MASNDPKKCAHVPCQCTVKSGEKFCGQACKEAGAGEVEIACNCEHPDCAVTV